jgi:anti-sigma B factor antagonist
VRHVELKVSCRSQGDYTIMSVAGEIDVHTAPRLQGALAEALGGQDPVRIVVDMCGVGFCDSTGLNVLLAAQRRAREGGGELELAGPRPAIRKVLQLTGLQTVLTVRDDIAGDDIAGNGATREGATRDDPAAMAGSNRSGTRLAGGH